MSLLLHNLQSLNLSKCRVIDYKRLPPIQPFKYVFFLRVTSYCEKLPPLKLHKPLITWSCEFDFVLYDVQVQNVNAKVFTDILLSFFSSLPTCLLLPHPTLFVSAHIQICFVKLIVYGVVHQVIFSKFRKFKIFVNSKT